MSPEELANFNLVAMAEGGQNPQQFNTVLRGAGCVGCGGGGCLTCPIGGGEFSPSFDRTFGDRDTATSIDNSPATQEVPISATDQPNANYPWQGFRAQHSKEEIQRRMAERKAANESAAAEIAKPSPTPEVSEDKNTSSIVPEINPAKADENLAAGKARMEHRAAEREKRITEMQAKLDQKAKSDADAAIQRELDKHSQQMQIPTAEHEAVAAKTRDSNTKQKTAESVQDLKNDPSPQIHNAEPAKSKAETENQIRAMEEKKQLDYYQQKEGEKTLQDERQKTKKLAESSAQEPKRKVADKSKPVSKPNAIKSPQAVKPAKKSKLPKAPKDQKISVKKTDKKPIKEVITAEEAKKTPTSKVETATKPVETAKEPTEEIYDEPAHQAPVYDIFEDKVYDYPINSYDTDDPAEVSPLTAKPGVNSPKTKPNTRTKAKVKTQTSPVDFYPTSFENVPKKPEPYFAVEATEIAIDDPAENIIENEPIKRVQVFPAALKNLIEFEPEVKTVQELPEEMQIQAKDETTSVDYKEVVAVNIEPSAEKDEVEKNEEVEELENEDNEQDVYIKTSRVTAHEDGVVRHRPGGGAKPEDVWAAHVKPSEDRTQFIRKRRASGGGGSSKKSRLLAGLLSVMGGFILRSYSENTLNLEGN